MRIIPIFILVISNAVSSQTLSNYTAIYVKTIETTLSLSSDKVRMNVGDNPMAKEMAEQALADLTGTAVQLRFIDSLLITLTALLFTKFLASYQNSEPPFV